MPSVPRLPLVEGLLRRIEVHRFYGIMQRVASEVPKLA
jgi:hypothetical protein